MGRTIMLWYQRTDVSNVTLYAPPIDFSQWRDATVMINIVSLAAAGTVGVSASTTLDPNNPNSFGAPSSIVTKNATGNNSGVFGGYNGGTTQAVGPWVRFQADLTGVTGAVVWSASVTLRD